MKQTAQPPASEASKHPERTTSELVADAAHGLWRVLKAIDDYSKHVQAHFGVTGPQLWALWELRESRGLTVTQTARRMHVHPSTVSGIGDRLEAKGLVKRVRDAHDRRVVHLEITRKGLVLIRRVPQPARLRLLSTLEAMPEQRVRAFAKAMTALADTMESEE